MSSSLAERKSYRGRLAPSPTGLLHTGHAATFRRAHDRARQAGGTLVFRNEDLDPGRCRTEFLDAAMDDLRWLGLDWDEGPDKGGPFGPYSQSQRKQLHREAFETLRKQGLVYPCRCSRKDVEAAAGAPQGPDDEFIYPGSCRPAPGAIAFEETKESVCWRFRVPGDTIVGFNDNCAGPQQFVCGKDFGDFVIWRKDGTPSYQLAVVADDAAMQITEVVRGADLILSTARQLLLYRALNLAEPAFYHCPLVTDSNGVRLSKRHVSLTLRAQREAGCQPDEVRGNRVRV